MRAATALPAAPGPRSAPACCCVSCSPESSAPSCPSSRCSPSCSSSRISSASGRRSWPRPWASLAALELFMEPRHGLGVAEPVAQLGALLFGLTGVGIGWLGQERLRARAAAASALAQRIGGGRARRRGDDPRGGGGRARRGGNPSRGGRGAALGPGVGAGRARARQHRGRVPRGRPSLDGHVRERRGGGADRRPSGRHLSGDSSGRPSPAAPMGRSARCFGGRWAAGA